MHIVLTPNPFRLKINLCPAQCSSLFARASQCMRSDGLLVCQGPDPQLLEVARLGPEAARAHELLSQGLCSLNDFTPLDRPILTFCMWSMASKH